jgi:hypothetical protein
MAHCSRYVFNAEGAIPSRVQLPASCGTKAAPNTLVHKKSVFYLYQSDKGETLLTYEAKNNLSYLFL